ncbi:hypothetical protein EB796_011754 [Bugula neritina]|uniref:beta-ketoacyl-[acyl-carrier-protein] synthase I n=1 Tax=Bugula neritina TaxID=10212 RepID=A0A7J7JW37_BUGNE|nr:hypothetical protein EB796_011754 [Bugula neritina]
MKSNRVVVTGIGIVSCLGSNLEKILYNVFKGYTGIKALELSSESAKESGGNLLPCRVAGVISESDLDLSKEFSKSDLREKSRPILLAVAAARRALSHSRLNTDQLSIAHRNGVSVGMGMPDLQEIYQTGQSLYSKGLRSLSPYFIPRNLVNMASGHISIETGFKGPNLSSSAACTTGLHSIGDAFRLVQRGDADVMICGSTEAPVCPLSIAGFSRMKALCTDSNDQPQLASRPFDKSRSGFVMSEGAAILILEEVNHALARDATIFGEILGYGLSGDAHHISSPSESGDGAFRCMESALLDSGLRPEDITYVNAHATSTPWEMLQNHRLLIDFSVPTRSRWTSRLSKELSDIY